MQRREAWRLEESGKDLMYWRKDRGNQLETSKTPNSSESLAQGRENEFIVASIIDLIQ